jgi:GDP-fucose protein O-fucosyltransferase
LTFAYDEGGKHECFYQFIRKVFVCLCALITGWNNVRMGVECVIVMAHAMGRTLVIPPQEHLYLLGVEHKDKEDTEAHDEMGFEDFFDISLLKSHKGFHVITNEEFLTQQGLTGKLKGIIPPGGKADLSGGKLAKYLESTSDSTPEWSGKFLALPDRPGDFNVSNSHHPKLASRLAAFRGQGHNDRVAVYYDEALQKARHMYFPPDGDHRLLQHYYGMINIKVRAIVS